MNFLLLAAILAPLTAAAQADVIPDSMKTDAHAVVRELKETLTLTAPGKATFTYHSVVTLLDDKDRSDLTFAATSTSFVRLEDADVQVFDAGGAPLQHIRKKEMSQSAFGEGLVSDGMTTYYSVTAPTYPLTIQIDFTLSYKGIVNLPGFTLNHYHRSIMDASYTVTLGPGMGIRYQSHLLDLAPAISADGRVYTWKTGGIRAARVETGAPSDDVSQVYLAPNTFELGGLPGDMSTWAAFGKWIYELNKDTYTLPESSKAFYRDMVQGETTDAGKARILYRYLQQNFRYVAIELGIGGLKSFPASFTETNKYGDCKSLSTYMRACLEAVGVRSLTALINGGIHLAPVDPRFPRNAFNHEILCIPRQPDSIWLECTSKQTDFGVLGTFTENRNALLITEHGGVLVRTPSSTPTENCTVSHTTLTLSQDGSGKSQATLLTRGEAKRALLYGFKESDRDSRKKFLSDYMDYPEATDIDVRMGAPDSLEFPVDIDAHFEKVPDFISGGKMFLNPHLTHIWKGRLPGAQHREFDYWFNYPFSIRDTTCYVLPAGFTLDQLPKAKTLSCGYAHYASAYWFDPTRGTVYSCATLTLDSMDIPPRDLDDVRRFFDRVTQDDAEKIVIAKP